MSDDIERLLAEVNKSTAGGASAGSAKNTPAKKSRGEVESAKSAGGRLAFAVVAAAFLGVLGFVFGLFMPFFGTIETGGGAAFGAFLTALVAGPPRWFSS
jgi:hypothetical protein